MRNVSTHISALALGAVLSTTLVLGGCGDKDKVKSASSEVKLEKIAPRNVSDAEANKALDGLALNNSGSGILSWADKSGSAGNYTYTDVSIKGDDDDWVKIAELELTGAHMEGDLVAFDKISFSGLSGEDDDSKIAVNKLELLKPSPTLSNEIARAFSGDDDAFENVEGDFGIGGLSLAGLDVTGDDANITLESMVFGETADKTGSFSMKNMTLNSTEKEPITMSLGSVNVTGMNVDKYKTMFSLAGGKGADKVGEEAVKNFMQSMNPYTPGFSNFSLRDFDVNANGLTIDVDSIDGKSTEKNGLTTVTQSTSPIIITPPANPTDQGMKQFADALSSMGYEKLVFQSYQKGIANEAADTMTVEDSYFELEDGFKLSYDYDVSGAKAMMDKAANNMGSTNAADTMEMMSSMKFSKMRLALKDNSIIDRGFKFAAEQQGGTPEALKMQAKAMLGFLPMAAKDQGQQAVASQLVNALGTLLDNGGTLVVEMNPATPVDLSQLSKAQSGEFDVSTLGLKIRTD
jgi:hypothetical protein